ncbi:hypothetical protein JJC04_04930 [Flavobacterium covae]|nr:hypothetical protein [Flavobacterium covae]QYS91975.1 hypothetical protein JJC04_04930 [Flavobacterium covae]
MKNREELFKKILSDLKNKQDVCEEFKYIGTGNPFSKILIIGKEASIIREIDEEQYNKEILENFKDWNNLRDFNSDKIKERDFQNYSPLYPYKGQILTINNGENFGTSKTWMNYQKLINFIFNDIDNKSINFHEYSFLTEVNSTPSRKTKDAKTESIPFRKTNILSSDFFKDFSVVIISGVGYFEISDGYNEIEKIFDVKFSEKRYANTNNNTQPFWVHTSETKIVINTHQLSIGISDLLLKEVASEVRKFLK